MLRILVATDGSPHALRAARAAAALAQAVQSAEVTVLTVAHAPLGTVVGLGAVTASGMAADYGGAAEAIFEEARATLDRTVEIFTAAGLAVTARLARGDPAAEIIRTATESGTDFIVMGTRGLGVVGKLVLGSVTEHVLHAAPCPEGDRPVSVTHISRGAKSLSFAWGGGSRPLPRLSAFSG